MPTCSACPSTPECASSRSLTSRREPRSPPQAMGGWSCSSSMPKELMLRAAPHGACLAELRRGGLRRDLHQNVRELNVDGRWVEALGRHLASPTRGGDQLLEGEGTRSLGKAGD